MQRSAWMPPAAAALGFLIVGTLEIVLDPGFRAAPAAPALVLALVVTGTLIAIAAPILGSTVVAALFPAATALGLDGPTGVGVLAYFLLPGWAGYRRDVRRSWIAPLAAQMMATAGVAIGGLLHGTSASGGTADLAGAVWENLFFSSLAWVSWAVGVVARSAGDRAARAERLAAALDAEREAREQAVLAEERQRIARDLHDSVAHSVSVMTLQVGAVRSTLPADAPQAAMLQGIERLGRESVAELRSAVGILRRPEDEGVSRPPTLERAGELVDEVCTAGLDVALTVTGEPVPLTRTTDVSAYRVLQESLTNVLRHAPGATAHVGIEWTATGVRLEVRNTPPRDAARASAPNGSGHGLVGMRERAALVGGTLDAGPTPDGGWCVRAVFPGGALA